MNEKETVGAELLRGVEGLIDTFKVYVDAKHLRVAGIDVPEDIPDGRGVAIRAGTIRKACSHPPAKKTTKKTDKT